MSVHPEVCPKDNKDHMNKEETRIDLKRVLEETLGQWPIGRVNLLNITVLINIGAQQKLKSDWIRSAI